MATGPGKYDDACTLVRMATGAEACLVIVLNGHSGCGFSVQSTSRPSLAYLCDVLDATLRQMRKDLGPIPNLAQGDPP